MLNTGLKRDFICRVISRKKYQCSTVYSSLPYLGGEEFFRSKKGIFMVKWYAIIIKKGAKIMIQLDNLKLELPALKAILMEVGESL